MTEFTPISAAIGGLLIGLSAVVMLGTVGRIAGVSGFVSRLLPPYGDREFASRFAFVAGIVAAPWLYMMVSGTTIEAKVTTDTVLLIAGGFLVGFGSVIGSGCTSGHGVCGLARLSSRSMAATAVFMLTAGLTVYLTRHGMGG